MLWLSQRVEILRLTKRESSRTRNAPTLPRVRQDTCTLQRRVSTCRKHDFLMAHYSITYRPICPHRWQMTSSANARKALPLPVEKVGTPDNLSLPQISHRARSGGRRANCFMELSVAASVFAPIFRNKSFSRRGSCSSILYCLRFRLNPFYAKLALNATGPNFCHCS